MWPILYSSLLLCQSLDGLSTYLPVKAHPGQITFSAPPLSQLLEEDARLGWEARFARPIEYDFTTFRDFVWHDQDQKSSIGEMSISVPGATGLFFALELENTEYPMEINLEDQQGVVLDRTTLSHENKNCLLEANGNQNVRLVIKTVRGAPRNEIRLKKVFYAYRSLLSDESDSSVLECHENVACQTDEKILQWSRGTTRILRYFEEGLAWCSGSLLNSTGTKKRPFILTAFHCIDGQKPNFDFWRFDFNYRSLDCEGKYLNRDRNSLMGAVLRSSNEASDFLLLELDREIPDSYLPYYLGWNAIQQTFSTTYSFHHPKGKPQMLSIDFDKVFPYQKSINWDNDVKTPAGNHLLVFFDQGTQETGSSGGPLLNENGELIGQLHGGLPRCKKAKAYFGWFARSLASGKDCTERLDCWLAPGIEGLRQLPGYDPNSGSDSITGKIIDPFDKGITSVPIALKDSEGNLTQIIQTREDGSFTFNSLDKGSYSVQPLFDLGDEKNGVQIEWVDGNKKASLIPILQSERKYQRAKSIVPFKVITGKDMGDNQPLKFVAITQ
ncbi:MAG: hypothetical protein HKN16_01230 [Saprospiraceae bacterium]|nr:hypothetical protein [Saprospiraceae bacterium]